MISQLNNAYKIASFTAYSTAGRQNAATQPAYSADKVSISEAARRLAAADSQAANAAGAASLPEGIRHFLERLVDEPAFGASYADGYVNNVHTACMTIDEAIKGRSALEAGQSRLQSSWAGIQAKGGTPAEQFAQLLREELSLPQSYWDAQDPGHSMSDIRAFTQAKADYLEQYIAAKKAV
ncbi:MAG: hypothetical protein ACM31P_16005 [Actinomycetota bacterium]